MPNSCHCNPFRSEASFLKFSGSLWRPLAAPGPAQNQMLICTIGADHCRIGRRDGRRRFQVLKHRDSRREKNAKCETSVRCRSDSPARTNSSAISAFQICGHLRHLIDHVVILFSKQSHILNNFMFLTRALQSENLVQNYLSSSE